MTSFEELDNQTAILSDDQHIAELNSIELETTLIANDVEQEQAGIAVADTLQAVSEETDTSKKLEIVTEHLLASIGYNKIFVMESFDTELSKNLSISQEGVLNRIGTSFKRISTTNIALDNKLKKLRDEFDSCEFRNTVIKDPGWSKYLIANSNKEITAEETISYYNKMLAVLKHKDIKDYYGKLTTALNSMADELSQSTFISSYESVKIINKINTDLMSVSSKVELFLKDNKNNNKDNYPNYEPLNKENAIKIYSLIKDNLVYDETKLTFEKACNNFSSTYNLAIATRLNRKDIRAVFRTFSTVSEAGAALAQLETRLNKARYAMVMYIQASIK